MKCQRYTKRNSRGDLVVQCSVRDRRGVAQRTERFEAAEKRVNKAVLRRAIREEELGACAYKCVR